MESWACKKEIELKKNKENMLVWSIGFTHFDCPFCGKPILKTDRIQFGFSGHYLIFLYHQECHENYLNMADKIAESEKKIKELQYKLDKYEKKNNIDKCRGRVTFLDSGMVYCPQKKSEIPHENCENCKVMNQNEF